jgi:hypothetical protein
MERRFLSDMNHLGHLLLRPTRGSDMPARKLLAWKLM